MREGNSLSFIFYYTLNNVIREGMLYMHRCKDCRFGKRTAKQYPCSIGIYQIYYSNKCLMWKRKYLLNIKLKETILGVINFVKSYKFFI
jgi:hypothetical protein